MMYNTPDNTFTSGVIMKRNNLIGQTFGRLTVLRVAGLNARQNVLWHCACVCGGTASAPAYDLRKGRVQSCGCLVREGLNKKHGMARAGSKRAPLYSLWHSMLARCKNKKDRNYGSYGGRGINVCKRWEKFENFLADMGEPPTGLTLERKDNNKGYTPRNCVWASRFEQNRNKRSNVWIKLKGKSVILTDALKQLGKTRAALHYQMKTYGLTHQEGFDKWLQQKKRL